MRWKRKKRWLAAVLIAALSSVMIMPTAKGVKATDIFDSQKAEEATEADEDDENLTEDEKAYKKQLKAVYDMPIETNELTDWPQAVGTYGDAAIVMDAESGAVLYAKNIKKQEYPASITKLLTALLAYEYDVMDMDVEITREAQECLGQGYASIGLKEGNVISMEQAMYAMLLASSNDVAYAIGETIAKSQGQDYDWFIQRMNQRCKELGGVNSSFINTNGVFDEEHYTCAFDMAVISRALFDYPQFFEICQTQQYVIPASATTEEHVFQQKHDMLVLGDKNYDERVIGGKTGYTTEAQNTLVTMAESNGRKLICVALYTYPGYIYTDTEALLDYGFDNFTNVALSGQEELSVYTDFPTDGVVTLPNGITLEDMEFKTFINGTTGKTIVNYLYEDMQLASYEVEAVSASTEDAKESESAGKEGKSIFGTIVKVFVIVLVAIGLLILLIRWYAQVQKERRRRERIRQRRLAEKKRHQREMMRKRKREMGQELRRDYDDNYLDF